MWNHNLQNFQQQKWSGTTIYKPCKNDPEWQVATQEQIVLQRSARLKVETKPSALGKSTQFEKRVIHNLLEEKEEEKGEKEKKEENKKEEKKKEVVVVVVYAFNYLSTWLGRRKRRR